MGRGVARKAQIFVLEVTRTLENILWAPMLILAIEL